MFPIKQNLILCDFSKRQPFVSPRRKLDKSITSNPERKLRSNHHKWRHHHSHHFRHHCGPGRDHEENPDETAVSPVKRQPHLAIAARPSCNGSRMSLAS